MFLSICLYIVSDDENKDEQSTKILIPIERHYGRQDKNTNYQPTWQ